MQTNTLDWQTTIEKKPWSYQHQRKGVHNYATDINVREFSHSPPLTKPFMYLPVKCKSMPHDSLIKCLTVQDVLQKGILTYYFLVPVWRSKEVHLLKGLKKILAIRLWLVWNAVFGIGFRTKHVHLAISLIKC